jgi:diguanylate cyclase (GGDEF)-like protein
MFQLLRYFTIAGSTACLILAIIFGVVLNTHQVHRLISDAEQKNVTISRLLANTIETVLPTYLDTPELIDPQSLRERPNVKTLDELFHTLTVGLNLLKIKIYNTDGLTLYSSDSSQIGESKSANPSFMRIIEYKMAASKLSFRNEFTAFSGVLFNLDVVETYIPIFSNESKIIGVFELCTDVTQLRSTIRNEMLWIFVIVISISILFFLVLFLIIRHADIKMKKQYGLLKESHVEIEKRTEVLYQQANYDDLTKLANRVYMYGQLKLNLSYSAKHKMTGALLFIDLDGFKNINDKYGHNVGDEVLVAIAHRLQESIREYDSRFRSVDADVASTIARIGGDEFTLIIPGISNSRDIDIIAKSIISECSKRITTKNKELFVSASIGITLYPVDGIDPNILMRNADLAMYQSKKEGKNTFRYFTSELNISGERRIKKQEG